MLKPLTVACAALLFCSDGLPGADGPRFAPEEGSAVRKTLTERTTLSLDLAEVTVMGEVIEPEELDIEVEIARSLAVVDTYAQLGDGRPEVLRRAFDELGGTIRVLTTEGGDEEEASGDFASELDGREVVFTWDEDAEAFEAAYGEEDEGADGELLEGLLEDADLRALLPPRDAERGEVEDGAEWELDAARLVAVLRPFGDLRLAPSPGGDGDAEPLVICSFFSVGEAAAELEGEATARLAGVEEGVARIEVELDLIATRDAQPELARLAEALEIEDPQFTQMEEFALEVALEGTAVLEWDLEAGRAQAFQLEANVEVALRSSIQDGQFELRMELSGETELALQTEEP